MLCLFFVACKRNVKVKEKSRIWKKHLEKAFDRVPKKVMEWAMRKKKVPEAMVKAVMNLYDGVKRKAKVGSDLSDEFSVNVGVHQGSVLSPLLFAIVVDAVTEKVRDSSINEILYADDLVLVARP